jgi:FkbM family methyltransferase
MDAGANACPVPKRFGGRTLWFHPRFLTFDLELVEPQVMNWIDSHLKPGSVFIDVGAHHGFHSLRGYVATKGLGRISAFEPSPANLSILDYHVRMNRAAGEIRVVQKVVCDHTAPDVEFCLVDGGDSSGNSLTIGGEGIPFYEGEHGERRRSVKIESVCLDDYCEAECLVPDLIKIDVEGAELLVLQGAKAILAKYRPALILSIHPFWLPKGQTTEQIVEFLHARGYRIQKSDSGAETEILEFGEYLCLA